MLLWALSLSLCEASEVPRDTLPADVARYTNSGIGLGVAHLGAMGPAGSAHRLGLHLEARNELAISDFAQVNLTFALGLTRPQNTLAVARWGLAAGAWTTQGFVDVTRWASVDDDWRLLRWMGAFFAYFGLGISYIAVPVSSPTGLSRWASAARCSATRSAATPARPWACSWGPAPSWERAVSRCACCSRQMGCTTVTRVS
jgi:hypothetical protein